MITYQTATKADIEPIFRLCKQLIADYEDLERIDYGKVLKWVHRKLEQSIEEYTTVYLGREKVGYYHFYQREDGEYEIDDLYVFPEYQNRDIGTTILQRCCSSVDAPVMLYVFVKNEKAISLYKRLGFKICQTVGETRYIMRKEHTDIDPT